MSTVEQHDPPTTDNGATIDDGSAADDTRLTEAVAGIGDIVPAAPLDLLAPRLRTPLFALFVALALGTHAAGLGAHVLLRWSEGDDGRNTKAIGSHVIEVDIIDGTDADANGGRADEAVPGDAAPAAPVAMEQAASAPSLAAPDEAPPPSATQTVEADTPSPPSPPRETELSTPSPAETTVATAPPEPPPIDDQVSPETPEPRTLEPPAAASPPAAPVVTEPDRAPAPSPAVAQPESAASQASVGGEDGSAQSAKPNEAPAGRAAATPGEIKTYHSRLGARLRAYKPSGFGRKGHVVVAFAVDADGGLLFAEIKKSTGNAYLESKALTAVRKAAPFPKPPVRMTGKQLEFSVPFTFE